MNYFLYARKSTDEEDRQILSIEAQLTEVRECAIKEKLNVINEFIESMTAKAPGRPIFNKMISLMEKGEAQGILAWHPDRLARNSVDGGKIIYLADKGIIQDLKFPTYRFDNTAQGKFMLSIAFGQSKYYVDNLAENIKRGIRQKIRNGVYSGRAPVGYLNDPKTRTIVLDKEKAPLIHKMFELYSTGDYGLERLIETITSLGFTTCNNKPLCLSKCQLILSNPFYYGLMRYWGETFEGKHEPIITKKLFDKVQEVVKQRGKPRKQHKHYFVFTGFMRCSKCGAMVTAEIQKGHHYYHCTRKFTPCKHSKQRYIREEEIAKQVKAFIQKVSLSDDWTQKILTQLEKDKNKDVQSSLPQQQSLKTKITAIEAKINKLIDLYLEGLISKEEYQKKKERLVNEKRQLQETYRDVAAGGDNWFEPAKQFVTSLNEAHYTLRGGNSQSQKEFLEKIGSNCILKERRLNFSSKKPYNLLLNRRRFTDWWS